MHNLTIMLIIVLCLSGGSLRFNCRIASRKTNGRIGKNCFYHFFFFFVKLIYSPLHCWRILTSQKSFIEIATTSLSTFEAKGNATFAFINDFRSLLFKCSLACVYSILSRLACLVDSSLDHRIGIVKIWWIEVEQLRLAGVEDDLLFSY